MRIWGSSLTILMSSQLAIYQYKNSKNSLKSCSYSSSGANSIIYPNETIKMFLTIVLWDSSLMLLLMYSNRVKILSLQAFTIPMRDHHISPQVRESGIWESLQDKNNAVLSSR